MPAPKVQRYQPSEQEIQFLLEPSGSSPHSLPRGPDLLRPIITGLLKRLRRHNEREARFVECVVQYLARIEPVVTRYPPGLAQALTTFPFQERLESMAPRGSRHWLPGLRIQRAVLQYYLTHADPPYPHKGPNGDSRRSWFSDHRSKIEHSLARIPCMCPQDRPLVKVQDEVDHDTSKTRLIELVLAHLHGTTPTNIHKLLNPSALK